MELHILWLYHDIKDVFGDDGNLHVLKKRCDLRHIDCQITTCGIGDEIDFSTFDLIYFGTNIDLHDTYVLQDLISRKENIEQAITKGAFFFLVGGGFAAFAKEYRSPEETVPALGVLDYIVDYCKSSSSIGNAYVATPMVEQMLIGFENHSYRILENRHPLGRVLMGSGNNGEDRGEGYYHNHILGTNLHGPLLPKNPELADKIIELSMIRHYPNIIIEPLEDTFEERAREAVLKRFKLPS